MNSPLYLRQNVQVEPLIESWYAWSHLISPATAAMNIVDRHLKIMQSYVQSPQVHAAAVKNPAMLGGPFIDYDGKRVDEIQALIDDWQDGRMTLAETGSTIRHAITQGTWPAELAEAISQSYRELSRRAGRDAAARHPRERQRSHPGRLGVPDPRARLSRTCAEPVERALSLSKRAESGRALNTCAEYVR